VGGDLDAETWRRVEGVADRGPGYGGGMLRKLPGLLWVGFLVAWAVRKFVPPEAIKAVVDKVQRGTLDDVRPQVGEVPAPEAADLHTPLPVA
jgi:hypothetical protein